MTDEITLEQALLIIGDLKSENESLYDKLHVADRDNGNLQERLYEAEMQPWPKWADDIRKKLMEYGYDAGPENEWDIGECFESWVDGCMQSATGKLKRDREALHARLVQDLVDSEKEIEATYPDTTEERAWLKRSRFVRSLIETIEAAVETDDE